MINFLRSCLSFTLIISLVYLPVPHSAFAGDAQDKIDTECSVDLYNVEHGQSTTGDQHMAYCTQADLARRAKNWETTKSVVGLAAAAACTGIGLAQMAAKQAARTAAKTAASTALTAATALTNATAAQTARNAAIAAMPACAAALYGAAICLAGLNAEAAIQYGNAIAAAGAGAAAAGAVAAQLGIVASQVQLIASLGKTCTVISAVTSAENIALDIIAKTKINKQAEKYKQAKDDINFVSTFISGATGMAGPALTSMMGGNTPASASSAASSASTAATKAADAAKAAQTTLEAESLTAKTTMTSATTSGERAAIAAAMVAAAVTSATKSSELAAETAILANATAEASSGSKGCLLSALGLSIMGAMSADQASKSKKAMNKALESAITHKNTGSDSVTNLRPAKINITQQPTTVKNNNNNNSTPPPSASNPCINKSGNDYLICVGTQSPEIAAISTSSDFLNEMSKQLHGKNLGDFAKGYNGDSDSDLANYVAGGLGMSSSVTAGLLNSGDQLAKDSKFFESYKPSGYTRTSSPSKSLGGDDLDFGKIMSGMMGKLDPNAGKEGSQDPSELVFRQLELLPADKIQSNKDISLFARIAFRYRKNTGNLEQLNWSRPENQGAQPAPASVKK